MNFIRRFFHRNAKSDRIQVLEPSGFRQRIGDGNVQLVDIRTSLEYSRGYIGHAMNIDFYSPGFFKEFQSLDKNRPVYIYCRSGIRSRKAAEKLALLDFKEIYDLKGGIKNWKYTF